MRAIVKEMFLLFTYIFSYASHIGSSVTMTAVLLGVQIMTQADTTRLLPLPGAGVYDPTMTECLISVAQLLTTGYHIIFRLPQDSTTDGFDKITYPHYGISVSQKTPWRGEMFYPARNSI